MRFKPASRLLFFALVFVIGIQQAQILSLKAKFEKHADAIELLAACESFRYWSKGQVYEDMEVCLGDLDERLKTLEYGSGRYDPPPARSCVVIGTSNDGQGHLQREKCACAFGRGESVVVLGGKSYYCSHCGGMRK